MIVCDWDGRTDQVRRGPRGALRTGGRSITNVLIRIDGANERN